MLPLACISHPACHIHVGVPAPGASDGRPCSRMLSLCYPKSPLPASSCPAQPLPYFEACLLSMLYSPAWNYPRNSIAGFVGDYPTIQLRGASSPYMPVLRELFRRILLYARFSHLSAAPSFMVPAIPGLLSSPGHSWPGHRELLWHTVAYLDARSPRLWLPSPRRRRGVRWTPA